MRDSCSVGNWSLPALSHPARMPPLIKLCVHIPRSSQVRSFSASCILPPCSRSSASSGSSRSSGCCISWLCCILPQIEHRFRTRIDAPNGVGWGWGGAYRSGPETASADAVCTAPMPHQNRCTEGGGAYRSSPETASHQNRCTEGGGGVGVELTEAVLSIGQSRTQSRIQSRIQTPRSQPRVDAPNGVGACRSHANPG